MEGDPADSQFTPQSEAAGPVTQLLKAASGGDVAAVQRLMTVVYDELHAIAQARMGGERRGHTLQPTALVNEAYIRLLGKEDVQWAGRSHFFRAAAEAMRKILIDYARAKNADKRGGGKAALDITNLAHAATIENSAGILALDEAILRLEKVDEQAAGVVRLKFYAGLGDDAVAAALGISDRTVRRDWAFARGWLRDALKQESILE